MTKFVEMVRGAITERPLIVVSAFALGVMFGVALG